MNDTKAAPSIPLLLEGSDEGLSSAQANLVQSFSDDLRELLARYEFRLGVIAFEIDDGHAAVLHNRNSPLATVVPIGSLEVEDDDLEDHDA